jgi:hypothetical protein
MGLRSQRSSVATLTGFPTIAPGPAQAIVSSLHLDEGESRKGPTGNDMLTGDRSHHRGALRRTLGNIGNQTGCETAAVCGDAQSATVMGRRGDDLGSAARGRGWRISHTKSPG